jgi:predicted phosphodiesterase
MKWDRRILVIPDLHLPLEDKRATSRVLEFAASERWDEAILLGDVLDCNLYSAFNEGKPRKTRGQSIAEDMKNGREWLAGFCRTVRKRRPGCKVVYIEGNHEERVQRYIDARPEHEGLLEIPVQLQLDDLRVQWVPFWSKGTAYQIGHASFIHGFSTIQNHAAKHARDWGSNVFYGHTHDVQEHSIYRRAKNVTIKGKSLGCLCDFEQPYMRGRPMRWQHAFGVFHFWPDGTFQESTVHIHKGRFLDPLAGKQWG